MNFVVTMSAIAMLAASACGDGAFRARGVVVTPAGVPVRDATVRAVNDGETVASTSSDENGCFSLFTLTGPGPHRFELVVETDAHEIARRRLWAQRDNRVAVRLERSGDRKSSIESVADGVELSGGTCDEP
jgi:hypothetical protein